VRTFTDGIFETEMDITNAEDGLNSAAPLRIGFLKDLNAGTSSNDDKYSVSGVKIFNAALPDAIVAQYFKKTGVAGHPYINSLMGFWSCLDGKGTILTDDAFGNNFSTTGTSWTFFNDMDPIRLQPDVNNSTYRQVPNSVDIPYMILSWLNTKKPAWDMDGYPWTPSTFVAY
jgi:hypothetical protein